MKQSGEILVIDDDNLILLSIRVLLEQHFTRVITETDPSNIMDLCKMNEFDVILLDMNFAPGETSGNEGITYLEKINEWSPNSTIILITAFAEIEMAVKGIKSGASDFITKPWENEKLISVVTAGTRFAQSTRQVNRLISQKNTLVSHLNGTFNHFIGNSESIREVKETIQKVSPTDASILIMGENGTGKELVARSIHLNSNRSNEVFLSIDMGAISDSLFESEMFGHRKGAFSDAIEDRMGKIEAAHGGTLFLDEISNLSLSNQARLLRVIQERTVTRVGSNSTVNIDIRIICASNQNLHQMVSKGNFRQDLLFRINTVEIMLPALRDRLDDLTYLAHYFLEIYKKKYHKTGLYVPEYIFTKLAKHRWPGNIRELEHAIERSVIMSDGKQLHARDFSIHSNEVSEASDGIESYNLESLEKWAIEKSLQKHLGNVSLAARELGLSRGALYRRMEKYEI